MDIKFVLGHALYMKAIHGGKKKNDEIDAHKIALLLKGGMLPQAYVYPRGMRETRDLLRRRMYLVRHAKVDDHFAFHLLRSVPGIGKVLALVLLYEIHRIERFASAGDFLSYARLVAGRGGLPASERRAEFAWYVTRDGRVSRTPN